LHQQADQQGIPDAERPAEWSVPLVNRVRPRWKVLLYESAMGIRLSEDGEALPPEAGECGVPQTVLAIWKGFVGSGITFLPGAFLQGGWLFSPVVLFLIAAGNIVCIWLLLDCSTRTGLTGFGDIAERAVGNVGKQAVLVSLVFSQFGTNVAYMIFISQMAQSLGSSALLTSAQVIILVVVVLIPLCWVRSIHRLEFAILGADVLIVFGLGAAMWYACQDLFTRGPDPELMAFKPGTCGLFMGTAIFTFEGLPYILPIKSCMRQPELFWPLFLKNFVGIVMVFLIFGSVGYANYGPGVHTVVLLNLPSQDPIAAAVRAAYMFALLLSSPFVFLSAARITELWVFGIVKPKGTKKWPKNAFRAAELFLFGAIAIFGGQYFEKFLAFTGAVCCAPIAFIYPALFHLVLCAESHGAKALDIFFVVFGVVAMVFVLWEVA